MDMVVVLPEKALSNRPQNMKPRTCAIVPQKRVNLARVKVEGEIVNSLEGLLPEAVEV
jgi:hypothetical protein